MMLILHIVVALLSLLQTTYMFIKPSKTGLRLSYGLMSLTLASGSLLIYQTGTHILEACLMGILYTGFVSFGIVRTRQAIAKSAV